MWQDLHKKARHLNELLAQCMSHDAFQFRRQIADCRRLLEARSDYTRIEQQIDRLSLCIEDSRATRKRRQGEIPPIHFPEELPITQSLEAIREAIAKHPVIIVCGETGSGKSTQIPKLCLSMGRGIGGWIGQTEPRRLATRAIASRIAEEMGSPLGEYAGYKIRFSERLGGRVYIKVMTDGVLLNEIHLDPLLLHYDTLIIDEAHERSLNIDFLLGYLKEILPKRRDLKVIITSATLDPGRFSAYFDNAPILEVSGRSYPVEVRYRPLEEEDGEGQGDLEEGVIAAVEELYRHGPGDILVFLPGEREIRDLGEALKKRRIADTDVLPLFSRLSEADQARIFTPHKRKRIILSTNVAETSLTVPGVHYVIDPGLARISRYSPRLKVQRLPIEPISQSSANQRAGRSGRIAHGICIRLYSEEDFLARTPYTPPEIQRTNLASVILSLSAMRLGLIEDFPFLDPPESRLISDGYRLLEELEAIGADRRLTPIGKKLAKMPIDPRIGRMLLAAEKEGALSEVLILAAALSIQDPRERPLGKESEADQAQQRFQDPRSDFLSLLNLWRHFSEAERSLSRKELLKEIRAHYLSPARMREWRDVHDQLSALALEMGLKKTPGEASSAALHRALLSGLLGNIGWKTETREYIGARGIKFQIFPGSVLAAKPPKWVAAAELTETSRLYARHAAIVEPEWIAEAGRHLVKRSYSDPHWEKNSARVMAYEKTTLYGLILSAQRKVDYGRIAPKESREIFIRHALVEGDAICEAPFFLHNQELLGEIEDYEHRFRRRDLLVDDDALYAFYDERIPEGICDMAAMNAWRRGAETKDPRILFFRKDDLLRPNASFHGIEAYPASFPLQDALLPLQYSFEPGGEQDGLTVQIPLSRISQIEEGPFEWLVPGLLPEKIEALIRSLPKSLRRNFAPAGEYAKACLEAMRIGEGRLLVALAKELQRLSGLPIHESDFRLEALPPHLRMNFQICDGEGQPLASGRDLPELRARHAREASRLFQLCGKGEWEKSGLTRWDFGALPEEIEFFEGGHRLHGRPALFDEGKTVAIRVFELEKEARKSHRQGIIRLFQLALPDQARQIERLPGLDKCAARFAPFGRAEDFKRELLKTAIGRSLLAEGDEIRTPEAFHQALALHRAKVVPEGASLLAEGREILDKAHEILSRLRGMDRPAWKRPLQEIKGQIHTLLPVDFLSTTKAEILRQYPRYLKGILIRLERLSLAPEKDAERASHFESVVKRYQAMRPRVHPGMEEAYEDLRWLMEEYRISVFAQEMKTLAPISVARIEKRLAEIAR